MANVLRKMRIMSRKRIYGLGPEQMGRLLSLGTDCAGVGADQGKPQDKGPGPEQAASDSACIKQAGTWVGRYHAGMC